jgi:hypothetical protein
MIVRVLGFLLVLLGGSGALAGMGAHFYIPLASQALPIFAAGLLLLPIGLAFCTQVPKGSSRAASAFSAHIALLTISLFGALACAKGGTDPRIITVLALTVCGQLAVGLVLLIMALASRRKLGIGFAVSTLGFLATLGASVYFVIRGL